MTLTTPETDLKLALERSEKLCLPPSFAQPDARLLPPLTARLSPGARFIVAHLETRAADVEGWVTNEQWVAVLEAGGEQRLRLQPLQVCLVGGITFAWHPSADRLAAACCLRDVLTECVIDLNDGSITPILQLIRPSWSLQPIEWVASGRVSTRWCSNPKYVIVIDATTGDTISGDVDPVSLSPDLSRAVVKYSGPTIVEVGSAEEDPRMLDIDSELVYRSEHHPQLLQAGRLFMVP